MQNFPTSPTQMAASFWHNRRLIASLVKREVIGRYRGSMMGILWSFFYPLVMLAVYTFVFSLVFKARWNGTGESRAEFALVLFAGLLVFNLFAECANRAPSLILANVNYVKKVVFPLEILPWVAFGSAAFHLIISFSVWLLFYAALFGVPHLTVFVFPLVLVPLMLMTLGLSWLLAALGVYLRDVGQIVGIVTSTLMFLTPIFYPVSSLPEAYRSWIYLNPLTAIVEQARQVLIWGRLPDAADFGLLLAAGAVAAWLGFAWFQKTRKGFADVL